MIIILVTFAPFVLGAFAIWVEGISARRMVRDVKATLASKGF